MIDLGCQSGCGQPYPDIACDLNGYVIVAGLDPGKEWSAPALAVYPPKEVSKLVKRIRASLKTRGTSLFDAVNEAGID